MKNNLSTLAYQVKPKENVGKITFQEHDNLNVGQTLALLCMGRCLCANYKHEGENLRMHEKKADNFISTHFVFVDCDGADISATQFCENIHEEYKPTCYYSSYSDDKNGTRRFHLLWFFDEPLNYIQAQTTGKFLNSVCVKAAEGKNVAIDTCNNPCQMLFGSFMPNEKYCNTNKLYTYNDIISSDEFQEFDMNDVEEKEVKHTHKAKKTAKNRENVPYIDYNMIKSFLEDSDAVFFEKYRESYYRGWVNYRYEKADEWLLSPDSLISYQYTDENYFALPYYIHNGHFSESSSESIKNWFMRELAISMLINQGCDINRVAYRLLLKIREQNVDSEGLLDQHTIIGAMESAATMTTQEIETMYAERLSFLRKVSKIKSGIIIRKNKQNKVIGYNTLVSQIKKELVLSVVSGQESPQEALAIVQQNEKTKRLDISLPWMENFYYRVMKFTQEKKMTKLGMQLKAIRELLEEDKNLSVRKLLALLKERKGITIGIATLQRRLKDLKELQNCN
jgi:hypothetical protein